MSPCSSVSASASSSAASSCGDPDCAGAEAHRSSMLLRGCCLHARRVARHELVFAKRKTHGRCHPVMTMFLLRLHVLCDDCMVSIEPQSASTVSGPKACPSCVGAPSKAVAAARQAKATHLNHGVHTAGCNRQQHHESWRCRECDERARANCMLSRTLLPKGGRALTPCGRNRFILLLSNCIMVGWLCQPGKQAGSCHQTFLHHMLLQPLVGTWAY